MDEQLKAKDETIEKLIKEYKENTVQIKPQKI